MIKLGAVLEDTEADLKDGNPLAEPSESKRDKGKDSENVASVDRSEPEIIAATATATHEAAAQVGQIYEADSDEEVLNWDLSDTD